MPDTDKPPRLYKEFDENDPMWQVHVLALRVDVLTKEKEGIEKNLTDEKQERRDLEDRVAAMERSFQRGAGALIVLPVVGTLVGLLFAYGKIIFAPWLNK